jgi:hypothetical protein
MILLNGVNFGEIKVETSERESTTFIIQLLTKDI